MNKHFTLVIHVGETVNKLKDELFILFHDNVFTSLVFALAIDVWNIKNNSEDLDVVIVEYINNTLKPILVLENNTEIDEIILLVKKCISVILNDLENTLKYFHSVDVYYLRFKDLNTVNDIFIDLVINDQDSE